MKSERKERKRSTLRALDEHELRAAVGGTRQQLVAAYFRTSNDAVAAFIEGFLDKAPL